MRRFPFFVACFTALAATGACSLINAPDQVKPGSTGGAGGGAASSSSSGMMCNVAADCKVLDDVCGVGICVNSVCQKQPDQAKEGMACDDGLYCTETDRCTSGTCTGAPRACPAAQDPCQTAACDEVTKMCGFAPGNDGASCDDGDACSSGDTCFAGACKTGAPTDCSMLTTGCTVGACMPGVGCIANNINEGLPCDINNVCANSQCITGKCTPTSLFNGKPCNDGLFCSDTDTCQNAVCSGQAKTCPGATSCKAASCDEANDMCTLANVANGTVCDDGNACTFGTTCMAGACTPAGNIMSCVNGDQCCPAGCTLNNDNDCGFAFKTSQIIDGQTVTCSSASANAMYTQCNDLKSNGLYFPNGVNCGPLWSMQPSPTTDLPGFCQSLTGSAMFEVYYTCDAFMPRATWNNHVWGTNMDNGYTQHVRCYY